MADWEKVLSWLEGLTFDDWRMYHSDAEVQNIAKAAFDLLKEQEAVEFAKEIMTDAVHETARQFRRQEGR